MTVVAVIALVIAVVAVVIAAAALRRPAPPPAQPEADTDLPSDVLGLRQEVAALKLESRDTLRHVAVVRYDAFGDLGGRMSWSLALLDDHASGVVLTAIHGRNDARTYAKAVSEGRCEQPLSPEEEDALAHARPGPDPR
ncbi:MAG: DUF4446 family protein [Marmoricola sp.]